MRAEMINIVEAVKKTLTLLGQRMDLETAPHRLEEFDALIEDPNLWNDPAKAQKLMKERQALMDEHMKLMREGMALMQGMGPGGHG